MNLNEIYMTNITKKNNSIFCFVVDGVGGVVVVSRYKKNSFTIL